MTDYVDCLRNIDRQANEDSCQIIQFVKKTSFFSDCSIPFSSTFYDCVVISKQMLNPYCKARGRKGVYIFKALNDFPFQKGVDRHTNAPNKKLVRKDGLVYVGMASQSLITRINDHFRGIGSSLNINCNTEMKDSIFVFVFTLKKEFEPYSKFITSLTESYLHKNPIYIGKKNNKSKGNNDE